jgi:molybdopterin-guanine dinucleotide biosynthesis protein A
MVKYTAIILSGGESSRFGEDKGLFEIYQHSLISFIIETVTAIAHEVIIVISDPKKATEYASLFPATRLLVDECGSGAAIFGVLTGLKNAKGTYSFLLPSDTPLVSSHVLELLKRLSWEYNAVIPRWPSGYIEPLQAIYRTREAYQATVTSIQSGSLTMRNMISNLQNILYLPTQLLEPYDPQLLTFYNINRLADLHKIKQHLKKRRR